MVFFMTYHVDEIGFNQMISGRENKNHQGSNTDVFENIKVQFL